MWLTHISYSVARPHARGDSVIYCVANEVVKEMKAMNSFWKHHVFQVQVALKAIILWQLTENKSFKIFQ